MRDSCLVCYRKHVAQAEVLMAEALNGYPLHGWLAVGHLAEAEHEVLKDHAALAETTRQERLSYIEAIRTPGAPPYYVDTITLLIEACRLDPG